jgi:hypothetical protein
MAPLYPGSTLELTSHSHILLEQRPEQNSQERPEFLQVVFTIVE